MLDSYTLEPHYIQIIIMIITTPTTINMHRLLWLKAESGFKGKEREQLDYTEKIT